MHVDIGRECLNGSSYIWLVGCSKIVHSPTPDHFKYAKLEEVFLAWTVLSPECSGSLCARAAGAEQVWRWARCSSRGFRSRHLEVQSETMQFNLKPQHALLPQTRPRLSQAFGSRVSPRKRSALTVLAAVKIGDKAPDFVLKDQVALNSPIIRFSPRDPHARHVSKSCKTPMVDFPNYPLTDLDARCRMARM